MQQMEQAYEVIIGLKIDPYCLATDPRGDSVIIKYLKLYEYKSNIVLQNILAWRALLQQANWKQDL